MALDEPKDTDNVYDVDNFKYIVDKNFMDKAKPVMVDFQAMGFKITSGIKIEPSSGCSGCGSTSSCC